MEHQWASLNFNGRREDGVFHRQIRFFETDPDPEEMNWTEIEERNVNPLILERLKRVTENINEDEIKTIISLGVEKDHINTDVFNQRKLLILAFNEQDGGHFRQHGRRLDATETARVVETSEALAAFVGEKDLKTWLSKVFAYDILDEY